MSFGQFLCANPHWDGTDAREPTPVEAAIELRSPLLHGLRVGKLAYLTSRIGAARRHPSNTGGDGGHDERDPIFRTFFGNLQAAERAIKGARERLRANPEVFRNDLWLADFATLDARDWSLLLDGIYAACVTSYPLIDTEEDMILVAEAGLYGASEHVAASLPKRGGIKPSVELVRSSIIAAGDTFYKHLAVKPE
jgi:hypothetical protein